MSTPRRHVDDLGIEPAREPSVDPTKNVLDLVSAAVLRLDNLRDAQERLAATKYDHLQQIIALQATHNSEIRQSEIDRLASIRQVDVLNQNTAAERQQAAILALERTTLASTETLRAMVDATAKTLAAQSAAQMQIVDARLAALERTSYEGKGKQQVADPQMAALMALVESLRESRSTHAGRSGGLQSGWSWIIGAVGLIAGLIGIFAALAK